MKNKKADPVIIQGTCTRSSDIGLTNSDPLGSYTGRPIDPYEVPVQDADDL